MMNHERLQKLAISLSLHEKMSFNKTFALLIQFAIFIESAIIETPFSDGRSKIFEMGDFYIRFI